MATQRGNTQTYYHKSVFVAVLTFLVYTVFLDLIWFDFLVFWFQCPPIINMHFSPDPHPPPPFFFLAFLKGGPTKLHHMYSFFFFFLCSQTWSINKNTSELGKSSWKFYELLITNTTFLSPLFLQIASACFQLFF